MGKARAAADADSDASPTESHTTPVGPPAEDPWPRPAVGKQLGRYVVLEVLGKGAMGEVFRAYDPKLRRELAIKRIIPTRLPADAETRLVREAQAMAQLGHPNVVAVYDVDVTDRGVVVAMEYVRGTTLEKWLRSKRSWPDIVRVFVQAARGLQAAHEAGLVHRDFKPANVLVAEDGRVRVADFGLVKIVEPERSSIDGPDVDDDPVSASSLSQLERVDVSLTAGDVVLGTPKYMAPEQYGSPALPASDQFAFCVSLWEALVGEPPYKGRPQAAIEAKFAGPPPWPRGTAIPRRIVAAIERGLSPRPENRFASMNALAAELAPDSGLRRPLLLGLGAAVAVATGLAVLAIDSRDAARCTGAQPLIEETWGVQRRERVEQAFVATGTSTAATAWTAAAAAMDAYADRWARQHREACEATTVRGEQSASVMDLRMACLGDARGELEAVAGVFEQADGKTVERAHRLLENLPDLARCDDVAALQKDVALPASDIADAVSTARRDLARSRALYRIGRYEDSLALADEVDARTRELDYAPIHAEAALGRGDVLDYLGRYDESEAALRRALQISLRAGSYDVAIKAATSLVYVVGQYLGRPAEALWPAELGLDLAIRIDADPSLEARARNAMGAALRVLARYDESEAAYREGIRRLADAVGEQDGRVGTLTSALGAMLTEAGRYDRAEPVLRRAHEIRKAVLGDRHPDVALSAGTIGLVLMELGRYADAEAPLRETLEIRLEAHGPDHFYTANARSELAEALTLQGRADEAIVELEIAVRSLEASLPEGHSGFIDVLHGYASTLEQLGRGDEAEAQARRALAAAATAYGPEHPLTGEEVAFVAELLAGRAQLPEAAMLARRAVAILEQSRGAEHVTTLRAEAVLGDVLLAQGDRAAAIELLETVWTIREPLALAPADKAHSAFALARALTEAPPPSARARELARAAADAYRISGPAFAEPLAEVEAWLAQ